MQTRLSRTLAVAISVAAFLGASPGPTLGQSYDPFANAHKIMSNRPLPATDSRLVALDYLAIPKAEPAWGPEPTEEQAYILLSLYIQAASRNQRSQIAYALSLFNDPEIKQKVPTPSLRAALLGLAATVGGPAVDFVLHAQTPEGMPKVKDIRFDDTVALHGRLYYLATTDEETQQVTILFNSSLRAESPFLFSSLLARLVLEQDTLTLDNDPLRPYYESLVARAFSDLVYLEQLTFYPELARTGSALSNLLNNGAAVRFNSGTGLHLGLYETNGDDFVLPEYATGRSWYAAVTRGLTPLSPQPIATPGNPLLAKYLQSLREPGNAANPPPSPADFNKAALDYIDQNQGSDSYVDLWKAATALELDVTFERY